MAKSASLSLLAIRLPLPPLNTMRDLGITPRQFDGGGDAFGRPIQRGHAAPAEIAG